MNELIQTLVSKADLSEAQAQKVAEVVKEYVGQKLPEPIRGPALAALTGERVDDAVDAVRDVVGKLFG
jgi:hypothetical protein